MQQMGLGGFFMHARVGLATPYLSDRWFECIHACVDEAEKLDLRAWLYDEDRWPSGAAGSLVTKDPKFRMRSVVMHRLARPRDLKWDARTLAAFTATVEGRTATQVKRIPRGRRPARLGRDQSILVFRVEVDRPSSWYNDATYLDTLSHEAVRRFIQVTHQAYRKHCGRELGRRIPGIFTDEPNYGSMMSDAPGRAVAAPWTDKLPAVFRRRYGYDLLAHLPEVFLDLNGQMITPARRDYHDCVTHLFVDAFSRQLGEWCEANHLEHTGHVLAEETLASQTSVVGSCLRFYEHMHAPGMDVLSEYSREYDTAKQVSSAARQFGRRWRLTETYGCTGWDFPFIGHKAVGDWQAALGINLRCPHLSWYTMEGEAKRDYPASIFYQSAWWQAYRKVEDYFARVHVAMTQGSEVRDLLVIHPVESMWMLSRAGWRRDPAVPRYDQMLIDLSSTLLGANIDFDYGDEDILARHGRVSKARGEAKFKVNKATYKAVLVPPLLTMRGTTLALLKRFRRAGGAVIFAGDVADYVDAKLSSGAAELARDCLTAPAKGARLVKATEPSCRRLSITDARGRQLKPTLHLLREDQEAFYLFVCNTGHDFTRGLKGARDRPVRERTVALPDVRISGLGECKGQPMELDPDTGERFAAVARRCSVDWEIRTSLPRLGSRLFLFPKKRSAAKSPRRKVRRTLRRRVLGSRGWGVTLSECNNLVLDQARYRIGSGRWQKATDILEIDRALRDDLGVPRRGGSMVQPWARLAPDRLKRTTVQLAYAFDVKVLPGGDLFLGLEQPRRFRVALNGRPVSTEAEAGWWTDRSLRRVPINPAALHLGTNEIVLTCDYTEDHPGLEIVYLLGSFGTKVDGGKVAITASPTSLKIGNWVGQGLAFYSGSVTYRRTIRPGLRRGERLIVAVPRYAGTAVRVLVDGQVAGVIAWEPNEIDITDLAVGRTVELGIEVLGHRRNSHGPLHLKESHPVWTGPGSFGREMDGYNLVPCGLLAPPQLIVRR